MFCLTKNNMASLFLSNPAYPLTPFYDNIFASASIKVTFGGHFVSKVLPPRLGVGPHSTECPSSYNELHCMLFAVVLEIFCWFPTFSLIFWMFPCVSFVLFWSAVMMMMNRCLQCLSLYGNRMWCVLCSCSLLFTLAL